MFDTHNMLTPTDIQNINFTVRDKRGYDTNEVDDFLDKVQATITILAPMAKEQFNHVNIFHTNHDEKTRLLYALDIIGHPTPKERPRFVHSHAVTPTKTRQNERNIRQLFKTKYPNYTTTTAPIEMQYIFYLKNHGRPDIDNLVKLISDALNGLAYKDDSQIIRSVEEKRQTSKFITDPITGKTRKRYSQDPLLYKGVVFQEHTEVRVLEIIK